MNYDNEKIQHKVHVSNLTSLRLLRAKGLVWENKQTEYTCAEQFLSAGEKSSS